MIFSLLVTILFIILVMHLFLLNYYVFFECVKSDAYIKTNSYVIKINM